MICPECKTGKHRNCDGNADMDNDGNFVLCGCLDSEHFVRKI